MRNTYNTEKTYEEDARCAIMVSTNNESAISQMIKKIELSISESYPHSSENKTSAKGGFQVIELTYLAPDKYRIRLNSDNEYLNESKLVIVR